MKEERRTLILEVAGQLFAERGAARTRVADVARHARVAVGSVYLEFPSKDALLGALASMAYGQVLGAMDKALRGSSPADPVARLGAAMEARFEAFARLLSDGTQRHHLMDRTCCASMVQVQREHRRREQHLLAQFIGGHRASLAVKAGDESALGETILDAHAAFAPPLLCAEGVPEARKRLSAVRGLLARGLRAEVVPSGE